jgi:hypothetical protein
MLAATFFRDFGCGMTATVAERRSHMKNRCADHVLDVDVIEGETRAARSL